MNSAAVRIQGQPSPWPPTGRVVIHGHTLRLDDGRPGRRPARRLYRLLVAAFAVVLLCLPWLNEQLFTAVWIGMKGVKANRVFTRVDFHLPRGLSVSPWRLS